MLSDDSIMLSRREFGTALTAPLALPITFGSDGEDHLRSGVLDDDQILMTGQKDGQGWVIQTNISGEIDWETTVSGTNQFYDILVDSDSNIVVGGESDSGGVVQKFDSEGNSLWTENVDTQDVRSIIPDPGQSGYVYTGYDQEELGIIGYMNENGDTGVITNVRTESSQQITINQLTSDSNSDFLWAGRNNTNSGTTGMASAYAGLDSWIWEADTDSEFYAVDSTSDQGIIFAGRTGDSSSGSGWLVRADANGDTIWEATTSGGDATFYDVFSLHQFPVNDSGFLCVGTMSGSGYAALYDEFGELQAEQVFSENQTGTLYKIISGQEEPIFVGYKETNGSTDGWMVNGSYDLTGPSTPTSTNNSTRGFFSNSRSSNNTPLSNIFNLTVLGFLLSVLGILYQMLRGNQ